MEHDAGYELGQAYDFLLKVIVIGESSTGKSCLLHHFIHNTVKENAAHTIGVEFASRIVRVGDKSVKLQLWDTAGQERFRSVTRSYYRAASACLLVFDISQRSSFQPLDRWLADARALASPDLVVVVVGNKVDREEEREVGYVEASRWASERGALYVETSSILGKNVEQPFTLACKSILLAIESGRINPETAGSGISYGDRGLRRLGGGSGGGAGGAGGTLSASGSSRFSFAEMMPRGPGPGMRGSGGGGGGLVNLQHQVKQTFGGCC